VCGIVSLNERREAHQVRQKGGREGGGRWVDGRTIPKKRGWLCGSGPVGEETGPGQGERQKRRKPAAPGGEREGEGRREVSWATRREGSGEPKASRPRCLLLFARVAASLVTATPRREQRGEGRGNRERGRAKLGGEAPCPPAHRSLTKRGGCGGDKGRGKERRGGKREVG